MADNCITKDDLLGVMAEMATLRESASITMREYFDTRIAALKESHEIEKHSLEHRLAALNELRGAMIDQANRYVVKVEFDMLQLRYDEGHKTVLEAIKSLELTRASVEGKASRTSAIIAGIIGAFGVVIGIAGTIIALVH